ncbi:MAG: metal ABC transporter substrate-binding protein [bacterium]
MKVISLILTAALLLLPAALTAAVKVVTSTTDLAYFAEQVGGDLVEVSSIASAKADLHYIETRPSYMVKLKNADLALEVGLELDMWMDRIIDGSHNAHLKKIYCSEYIEPLKVPKFKADASHGDLHRFGNPHYWLSPDNVAPITQAILEGLSSVDPEHAETYSANRQKFLTDLDAQLPAIRELAAPLRGKEMITYHNSWPYFAQYFGIELPGFVEKYPGVAPSPAQVSAVVDLVKERGITLIVMEPYFDQRIPAKIASLTGAHVVVLYPSIGGRQPGETYIEWLRGNIQSLLEVVG